MPAFLCCLLSGRAIEWNSRTDRTARTRTTHISMTSARSIVRFLLLNPLLLLSKVVGRFAAFSPPVPSVGL